MDVQILICTLFQKWMHSVKRVKSALLIYLRLLSDLQPCQSVTTSKDAFQTGVVRPATCRSITTSMMLSDRHPAGL
ncbi:MAG TPA: hypothetical protein ENL21_05660 [Caldithrix abyssi]|uniref:Uncharacterized protein n=1 Tax=Caldithrix abyssi TaxID=187145 RepID=A0A7V5H3N1_CALAY|nr:hypothetical protein [Caldithrix abyssi]